jgi:hypothetical protein
VTTGAAAALANGWLDGITGWYLQLHTGDPGAAGTTANCTGTVGGDRKQSTMAAASGGSKSQTAGGSWASWDGGSVTISHISCWTTAGSGAGAGTADTGGTFNFSAALSSAKAITNGDTYNHTALIVSIAPVAA